MSYITYQGYEIFPFHYKPLSQINKTITHKREFIGDSWNKQNYFYFETERFNLNFNVEFLNYKEFQDIKNFLLNKKGKYKDFWLPDYTTPFYPENKIEKGTQILNVKTSIFNGIERPLFVLFPDYAFATYVLNYKITSDIENNMIIEYNLADTFPYDTNNDNCIYFCFMYFGRLDNDVITFNFRDYKTGGEVALSFLENSITYYKQKIPLVNSIPYVKE
jgi:hypothetical protein